MATGDVMPFTSPLGGHMRMISAIVENSAGAVVATFKPGEWVELLATGMVDELAAGSATVSDVHYIAAENATANLRRIGDARYGTGPNSAAAFNVSLFDLDHSVEFITKNVYTASDTLVTSSLGLANINDYVRIRVTAAGAHGVDTGTADSTDFIITRLLDSLGRDIASSGQTCVYCVFKRVRINP